MRVLQVGRSGDAIEDAKTLAAIHRACNGQVVLRADANRRFSYEEALAFAQQLQLDGVHLDYIEEPVADPVVNLGRFVESTGLSVALDESLDDALVAAKILGNGSARQEADGLSLDGVVALVVKPAILGSLERTVELVRWAAARGLRVVMSSTFESSLGTAQLAGIARATDAFLQGTFRQGSKGPWEAHGLGTIDWLREDVIKERLKLGNVRCGKQKPDVLHALPDVPLVGILAGDVASVRAQVLQGMGEQSRSPCLPSVRQQMLHVQVGKDGHGYRVACLRASGAGPNAGCCRVLFLHGFLGSAQDWQPIMASLQVLGIDSAAIDLPGHGTSQWTGPGNATDASLKSATLPEGVDLQHMAAFVQHAIRKLDWEDQSCAVIGYSLGARVALQVAAAGGLACIKQIVAISGSPGIPAGEDATSRVEKDAQIAAVMRSMELSEFVRLWYAAPMWASLRRHPAFSNLVATRSASGICTSLAHVLECCTPGRQNHWDYLHGGQAGCKIAIVVGEEDPKFVRVAQEIVRLNEDHPVKDTGYGVKEWETGCSYRVMEVHGAGHAVHLEQPLSLSWALLQLLLPDN
jgi:isochorismate synthase / 2-succinyl-5-enolpyruvyl-6-hydroxy-3-cyclohexene-1-carboxylate synthase / 2-succinyl-6-hydroxy-2,4-cyclohexadiene-1-carboxylate synthase / o-succinylbenzoate synthase